jgi:NADH-quinone oxidoreductase subunit M
MHSLPLLSLAIWVPILFGVAVLGVGASSSPQPARWLALIGAAVSLLLTIPLVIGFQPENGTEQFVEQAQWLPTLNSTYHLGIDGISLWLVVLTAFTTLVIIIASWGSIKVRVAQYLAAFLLLSGFMIGVFASLDGMLFFVFFEATLIPFYLLIGGWGGANRVYAAVKFFIFSLVGSLAMLVALIYLYAVSHSFDLAVWRSLPLSLTQQVLIFLAFFAAFAVKVPMWPLHTWLPDAHFEAPIGASVMLSVLKLGAYGFLRFSLPILPDASHFFAPVMIVLSLIAVIYASLIALAQTDMSKMIAYSSVSHMGLVTLGLFIFNQIGAEGAIVQLISYGFVSGAMFLCVGVLNDRMHSHSMKSYGGVVNVMPKFAVLLMVFAMANVGLPGTSGFVGEFLVIMGAIKYNFWIGAAAASTMVLSATYQLWMYKRVIFGPIANERVAKLQDLGKREMLALGAMAAIVLAIGVYPHSFTNAIGPSTTTLLSQAGRMKTPGAPQNAVAGANALAEPAAPAEARSTVVRQPVEAAPARTPA